MDSSQSHRKLTKKPPVHSETPSAASVHRTLRRTPSAPMHPPPIQTQGHRREASTPSPTATASSRSSASRQHHRQSYTQLQRSPHSHSSPAPMLFGEVPSIHQPRDSLYTPQARQSVTEKTSSELIGAPFDSAAVLSNFHPANIPPPPQQSRPPPPPQPQIQPAPLPVPAPPVQQQNLTPQFTPAQFIPAQTFDQILQHQPPPPQPQPSKRASISQVLSSPRLRQSASFYQPVQRQMETATTPRSNHGTQSPRQRYSDEANGSGGGAKLRKKSGISNVLEKFMSSPRKPQISAPENPVHVTHVGYNEETGEFTVRLLWSPNPTIRTLKTRHDF